KSELAVGLPGDRGREPLGSRGLGHREAHGRRVRVRHGDARRRRRGCGGTAARPGWGKGIGTSEADAEGGAARRRPAPARAGGGNGPATCWITRARTRLLEAVAGAAALAGGLGGELLFEDALRQLRIRLPVVQA